MFSSKRLKAEKGLGTLQTYLTVSKLAFNTLYCWHAIITIYNFFNGSKYLELTFNAYHNLALYSCMNFDLAESCIRRYMTVTTALLSKSLDVDRIILIDTSPVADACTVFDTKQYAITIRPLTFFLSFQ